MALACVKQAAARANAEVGVLDDERAALIDAACNDIRAGKLHDQFVVDLVQGGAGTSSNMNANEVITNRALEIAGRQKGDYGYLSVNDHTNCSQSTNDIYPTALKVALVVCVQRLLVELNSLADSFRLKSVEFGRILKIGRTQLQDAVPMSLGQEFGAFSTAIRDDMELISDAMDGLLKINLGGTAIGTGINVPVGYREAAVRHLGEVTGIDLASSSDLIESTSGTGSFVTLSSALKRCAIRLSKTANDLRLLSSGPQSGLGEICLPARQAGSSIMPGKVNPVIPELVSQVAYAIVGYDQTVSMAAESGQLQLNAFEPIIAHCLFDSIGWLERVARAFREKCVTGISANEQHLAESVSGSITMITALAPAMGYRRAAEVAQEALVSGTPIVKLVSDHGLLDAAAVETLLRPEVLAGVGFGTGDGVSDSRCR